MAKSLKDLYGQQVHVNHFESATGTPTYVQVASTINSNEAIAMIIHRIEYFISGVEMAKILDNADSISLGFVMWSNGVQAVQTTTPGIIDFRTIERNDFGTAGNAILRYDPMVSDFTSLPGGGKICHPASLWSYILGTSLASAVQTITSRVYYTTTPLTDSMYRELYDLQIVRSIVGN
jgi:hypothetical protein